MSGHSKWSNIKFRKEIADKKKGKIFTKLAHLIAIAAREKSEIKLRLAIEKAKQANLPTANIDRAIKRGTGELGDVKFEDATYEAFGPEKVAILISITTDNKNRTSSQIRNILDKSGGKLAGSGSVSWMFEQKGIIRIVPKGSHREDKEEIELIAIDAGADDVTDEGSEILIYTKPEELEKVKNELQKQNLAIINSEISMIPKNIVKVEDASAAKKILKLMDELDNIDEVVSVAANFDIPDDLIKETEA